MSNISEKAVGPVEAERVREKARRQLEEARARDVATRREEARVREFERLRQSPLAQPRDQVNLSSEARPGQKAPAHGSRLDASLKINLLAGGIGVAVTGAVLAISGLPLLPAFGLAAALVVPAMAFMYGVTWVVDRWRQAPAKSEAAAADPKPAPPASQADRRATDRAIDTVATVHAVMNIASGKGDALDSVYLVTRAGKPEADRTMRNVYLAYQVGKAIGNLATATGR